MATRKRKGAGGRKKSATRKKSTNGRKKSTNGRKKTSGRKKSSNGRKKGTGGRKKSSDGRKKGGRRKYGAAASESVREEMHEMKRGRLKSGRSGKKVTSRKQAIAIGLSEARRKGAKVPSRRKKS
jgi:hypothetical protein